MTDYNDGKWHGWNGGECPVHPETIVTCRLQDEASIHDGAMDAAKGWEFEDPTDPCSVIAFRVVRQHKEPEIITGECWAYHYRCLPPSITATEPHLDDNGKGNGTYTATHVDGRLVKIVWERKE